LRRCQCLAAFLLTKFGPCLNRIAKKSQHLIEVRRISMVTWILNFFLTNAAS
jgi:hypothetical protein